MLRNASYLVRKGDVLQQNRQYFCIQQHNSKKHTLDFIQQIQCMCEAQCLTFITRSANLDKLLHLYLDFLRSGLSRRILRLFCSSSCSKGDNTMSSSSTLNIILIITAPKLHLQVSLMLFALCVGEITSLEEENQ